MKRVALGVLCLALSQAAFAQDSGKTLVNILVKHWQASKDFSIAVANAMPDDGYDFHATAAEMSYGEQMNHIALADANYCSAAIGAETPLAKSEDNQKTAAIQNLNMAYDYCIAGIEKMTDTDLLKPLTRNHRTTTAYELYWGAFTHAAHHRGQAEVYLRLKGVTPPSYKF